MPIDNELSKKMWKCADLLPPPGPEVLRDALAEIERLQSTISQLREALVNTRANHNAEFQYYDDWNEMIAQARREIALSYPNLGPWDEEDDAR